MTINWDKFVVGTRLATPICQMLDDFNLIGNIIEYETCQPSTSSNFPSTHPFWVNFDRGNILEFGPS